MENKKYLEKMLLKQNIPIEKAPSMSNILYEYMLKLLEWNTKINVTNIVDEREFIHKHLIDSLALYGMEELKDADKILDIGTGGGFPGVPLAVACPEKKIYLLDAVKKKLNVVESICQELDITNVQVLHARAEDLANDGDYREDFDLVVSRAVANLSTLSELALPFVTVGGSFIAYKGANVKEEIYKGEEAIEILGGEIDNVVESNLDDSESCLLVITKTKVTPKKFPRKAGQPKKRPLGG